MNKKEMVNELNRLLRIGKLDLPAFRTSVTKSGKNVSWLIKNIKERNPKYDPRIDELLEQLVSA